MLWTFGPGEGVSWMNIEAGNQCGVMVHGQNHNHRSFLALEHCCRLVIIQELCFLEHIYFSSAREGHNVSLLSIPTTRI